MKLHELFDTPQRTVTPKKDTIHPNTVNSNIKNSDTTQKIGSGVHADVFIRPTRPGTVVKMANVRDINNDGYYQYITQVSKLAQSNPFFPRIYNIKFIKSSASNTNDKGTLAVEIEKLVPLETLTKGQTAAVRGMLFNLPDEQQMDPVVQMTYILDQAIDGKQKYIDLIKNPLLLKAVQQISSILTNNENLYNDLHEDNIMCRLTPNGPQLVISDPLSG